MSSAFRIERFMQPDIIDEGAGDVAAQRHNEVMDALGSLKKAMAAGIPAEAATADSADDKATKIIFQEIEEKRGELERLRREMREIYQAIEQTKCQILTIKESGSDGQKMDRVAEELSLIVKGTEEATDNILHSAEMIDNNASNLVASLQCGSQQALACEIQEQIVNIFESCNFQDLTGQRITRVVKTFCFIEQRIMKMMDIWGGPESFHDVTPDELESRQGDKSLLNGPSLEMDEDVASQEDIDALFD